MKVADFLRKEWTLAALGARDKEGSLRELVDALVRTGAVGDAGEAVDLLLEREKLGSTGIGEGVAIPHGKMRGLDGIVGVFGRSAPGVDFDSMDGEPVHLFFLLMAPENAASLHLQALARISRLLKSRQFRDELLRCSSPEELFAKISAEDEKN